MMSLARSHSRRASIVALAEQIYEQESPISGVVMEIDRSRRIAGLTISDLARMSGMSRDNLSRVFLGRRKPTSDTVDSLIKAMGLEIKLKKNQKNNDQTIDVQGNAS